MVPITSPITHKVMASGTSTSRPVANTDFNVVFLVVIYTAGRPPRLDFTVWLVRRPMLRRGFRADICVRTIGQIERLSAVKARVELRFRFRLRASFQGTRQRQFDAGAAGFADAAGADAALFFELSDAAALAVDESDFED